MSGLFKDYKTEGFFSMKSFLPNGEVRPHYKILKDRFEEIAEGEFERKLKLAEQSYINQESPSPSTVGMRGRSASFRSISFRESFPPTSGSISNAASPSVSPR